MSHANRIGSSFRLIVAGLVLALAGAGCGVSVTVESNQLAAPSSAARTAADPPAVGSLDGARVAIPTGNGRRQLLYLAGQMSDEELATLARIAPNVRCIIPESEEQALFFAPQVHGADARHCSAEFLAAANQLVWVQSPSAGVAWILAEDRVREDADIVLTNMQGVHGPAIAEHVFGMLLSLTRDLRYYHQPEQQGTWNREGSGSQRIALSGRTMLVVGLGGIGREVARRADGFDMEVLATRRSRTEPPPYVDRQETSDKLDELLPLADVVVLCVPLTDETTGMINERTLALMKPGSYLVNIARGPVVDQDALIAALDRGHLAGACLDVTDPEPLPADHPLWGRPDVIITPHMSSWSSLTGDRRMIVQRENIRRFGAGEPLLNVVDKVAGY